MSGAMITKALVPLRTKVFAIMKGALGGLG
jgi:hypothetical protein